MKQFFNKVKSASIVLLAIFVLACGDEEAPPQVTSSFTQTVDNTTGAVTFKNTSTNATSYLWDLGDGTTSTAFEPVKSYQTGNYTVKLTASNSAGGTATSQNTFTVTLPVIVDTTKPVITLVGEATINLTVGDPYIDKGATANDNLDGNITANIVKGGATVDTSTPGSYVITYNVSDAAKNAAVEVKRTVAVVAFDDGLLTNGAFSSTTEAWTGNGFDVRNDGGSNYNFANPATAGNAFDVNLSQKLTLAQGSNYILSFDASSDRTRTMLAGIGLSVDPFTNDVKTVNLTTTKQTFTLELSAAAFGGANSRVLFDMGAAVGVVVIDNVKLILGPPPACTETLLKLPINFDCGSTAYTFSVFNGASYQVVDNPFLSGVNDVASKVGKIVNVGANYEGGAFALGVPVDFATNKSIKMKVYSTTALPVLLKFERVGDPIETSVNHGGTGWEELTFDFTSSAQFNTLVLFIDGPGTTAGTFYMDDIKQVATVGGPGACPAPPAGDFITDGDFETGAGDCWIFVNDIGINKGTVVVTNAENNTGGGTYSVKIDTNPFGNPAIKKERFGVGTILPSTVYQVKLDSKVSSLVDGAVVNVLAFSEKTVGGAVLHNLGSINTTPGAWNTKTATFTTDADVSGGVSLLIEVVCGGAGTCDGVVYFDNISFKIN